MLQIHTATVNNPEWVELQYQTLKTFLTGDWQFTVFNDAKDFPDFSNFGDPSMRRRIADVCSRLNIPCVPLENQHHRQMTCAATRCYNALQQILECQRVGGGRVLGLDSDMFLMRPTDASNLYKGYTAAVVPQARTNDAGKTVEYFWNGLYMFDFDQIGQRAKQMDWRCNDVEGVWTDVGGGMHPFLKTLQIAEIYPIPHLVSGAWGFDDFPFSVGMEWLPFCMSDSRNQGSFFSEIYDERFLHFRGGGNWERRHPTEYTATNDLLRTTILNICKIV